jgi:serine/threonine-protein kinase HipA
MDGATQRPVQWYFDNLLPEEGQRSLLAADATIDKADAFGLLAYSGRATVFGN